MMLIACCLIAQVLTSWHSAQHVHDDTHCSVCAVAAQLGHAVLPDVTTTVVALSVIDVVYSDTVIHGVTVAMRYAYNAQGPPAA